MVWLVCAREPGATVVDCGCGPGSLWRTIAADLPPIGRLVLTDLSSGMLAEARRGATAAALPAACTVADVISLPLLDGMVDLVVANHMLYHVPQPSQALAEIRRVLKPDGYFMTATNGRGHLTELRGLGARLLPSFDARAARMDRVFSLENGAEQLAPYFADVQLHRFQNELLVSDADDLIAYWLSSLAIRSTVSNSEVTTARVALRQRIAEQGAIRIGTDSGVFTARKPRQLLYRQNV